MNKTIVTKKSNSINVKVGSNKNQTSMPGVVMEYGVKSVNGLTGNVVIDADNVEAISYGKEQNLTEEQTLQARTNIGLLPSETLPIMDSVADTGDEISYARGDHVHPTDTSRASQVEFSEFKTDVQTNYATKEYVDEKSAYIQDIQVNGESLPVVDHAVDITVPTASDELPLMDDVANAGVAETFSRSDHVHPTDTSRAAQVDLEAFEADVEENYATKEYVEEFGGKIDSISVNGVIQPIDVNKNVDLLIPDPNDYTETVEMAGVLAGNGLIADNNTTPPTLAVAVGNGLEIINDRVALQDELIFDCGTSTDVIYQPS